MHQIVPKKFYRALQGFSQGNVDASRGWSDISIPAYFCEMPSGLLGSQWIVH
ncbi:hypothetical protein SynMVIR181_00192 [Synechococcus sp. MVIR-18-1]|nr:hypothetical protein SynMVIR181_00192 [Synechococcus sp. MVIR-18-1]